MSKKLVKILALALSAVLLVGATIAGTVAYLTSQVQVSNTFTSGNVAITMNEAKADLYGTPADPEVRVESNEYKLIPGHQYTKNTKITVDPKSETCYLFVKIDAKFASVTDVDARLVALKWKPIAAGSTVYYYCADNNNGAVVEAGSSITVIEHFKVNTDFDPTSDNFTSANFVAYAVQSDGFGTAVDAWNNTFGKTAQGQS